jgi:hypothetical protein
MRWWTYGKKTIKFLGQQESRLKNNTKAEYEVSTEAAGGSNQVELKSS